MDIEPATWAIGGALIVGLVVLTVVVNEALRNRVRIGRRVAPLADMVGGGEKPEAVPAGPQTTEQHALAGMLDRRYPLAGGVRTALIGSAGALVVLVALVPSLVFCGMPTALAIVVGLLLAIAAGWTVGATLEQRQRLQFNDRFLVVIDDFQRMVRFGIATSQALKSIATSAEEPVKTSLRRVTLEADFGVPLGVALGREAHRIRISEMAMLAAIVSTQTRTGGGLAESVGNLAEMLRERIDNRHRMKSATSESKISLIVLSGVPFAAIGIQAFLQPELVNTLLNDARHLLGIGAALIVAGLVCAWFLVRDAQR